VSTSLWLLIIIIALATGLAIINGWNDAANSIATVIGTRVLSPNVAVAMAAILNFAGTITGLAVAKTIGQGVLVPGAVSFPVAIAALLSIVIWGTLATLRGFPLV